MGCGLRSIPQTLLGVKLCRPTFQIQGTACAVQEKQLSPASDLLSLHVYLKHKCSKLTQLFPALRRTGWDGAVGQREATSTEAKAGVQGLAKEGLKVLSRRVSRGEAPGGVLAGSNLDSIR